MRGKLVAIYGVNNLGKTTQAKRLVKALEKLGRKAISPKIPAYKVEPSGPMLDEYLRQGNPYKLTQREADLLFAFNRSQFEPRLVAYLEQGWDVILEDYWGTGVAWGVGRCQDKEFLLRINSASLREDLAVLLHGKRFYASVEKHHLNEPDSQLTERVAEIHFQLAQEFGWKLINANGSIESVGEEILKAVKKIL